MQLNTGLGGGFALAAWPGTAGTAAGASPQGPATAAGAAYGTTADAGGKPGITDPKVFGVLSVGTAALIALVWVWYALPR